MKKILPLILAALTAAAAYAADQVPLFNATLAMGRETRFLLLSPAGKTSPWLKVGDAFEGYTLKAYDAKATALDLEREGKITRITLVSDAAVTSAPATAPTPATLADATALLSKIHIEDLLDRSLAGQKKIFASQIEKLGQNFPNADPNDLADFKKRVMAEFEAALDKDKLKEDITRIYSETFTKSELEQVSAFYDTPLGQVLLAKQPEVQQKMQAAVMPRVAELTPKIQTMAREFAVDQQAKQSGAPLPAPAPAPKP